MAGPSCDEPRLEADMLSPCLGVRGYRGGLVTASSTLYPTKPAGPRSLLFAALFTAAFHSCQFPFFAPPFGNADIQGMGFDALWISPVVDNLACGYHGYWARHLFEIEARFGGAAELHALMAAARARGIAVMLDIVANHMGPPSSGDSFQEFTPFNSTDHYHGTLASHCDAGAATQDHTREICWLVNLGDLRQENPYVAGQLLAWMQGLQKAYHFDAVRIDTVPYVRARLLWMSRMHLFPYN